MAADRQIFCFICGQHHLLAEMEILPVAEGGHSAPVCVGCLPEARQQLVNRWPNGRYRPASDQ